MNKSKDEHSEFELQLLKEFEDMTNQKNKWNKHEPRENQDPAQSLLNLNLVL